MSWEQILSILAIFISAIVGLFTLFQNRKSNSLQERIVELEEQRATERKRIENSANITVSIEFEESKAYRFPGSVLISNDGMVSAENLRVLVEGKPPSEVSILYTEDKEDELEVLPAGDYYDYPIVSLDEKQNTIEVTVIYDDPTGKNHKKPFKLRLY